MSNKMNPDAPTNTYLVTIHKYGQKTVQAHSPSAAKYAAYMDYDVTGGLGFMEYLKWVKSVKLLHKFHPSDLYGDPDSFERMKVSRGIPFAEIGGRVILHPRNRVDLTGVICSANSQMNLDILLDGTTHLENCHPCYRLTYLDRAGEPIAHFN